MRSLWIVASHESRDPKGPNPSTLGVLLDNFADLADHTSSIHLLHELHFILHRYFPTLFT